MFGRYLHVLNSYKYCMDWRNFGLKSGVTIQKNEALWVQRREDGEWEEVFPPHPTLGSGSIARPPSGVRGGARAENGVTVI